MSSSFSPWWKRKILYKLSWLYKKQPCGNYHPVWHRLCFCRVNEYDSGFHGGVLDLKTGVEYHKYEELEDLQSKIQRCLKCGQRYWANSHEYPCPWCELSKLEKFRDKPT
jgi:hypothetical protein